MRVTTRTPRFRWRDMLTVAGAIVLAYLMGIATALGTWPF